MPLMDVGFAIICSLARHRRPQIQFLSIGSRVCSTLLSDLASRHSPCASLTLLLHQGWVEDFHLQAIEHARHTNKSPPRQAEAGFKTKARLTDYTLAKMIARVNSARVSMNTRPRIIAVRMFAEAPGLRAIPSQADAATLL